MRYTAARIISLSPSYTSNPYILAASLTDPNRWPELEPTHTWVSGVFNRQSITSTTREDSDLTAWTTSFEHRQVVLALVLHVSTRPPSCTESVPSQDAILVSDLGILQGLIHRQVEHTPGHALPTPASKPILAFVSPVWIKAASFRRTLYPTRCPMLRLQTRNRLLLSTWGATYWRNSLSRVPDVIGASTEPIKPMGHAIERVRDPWIRTRPISDAW
ncbi:hypothetical protein JVT61DRAFT_4801 [Boletus reticuloceps]|uniref:Uncharacterized protein n=1 Tax=Boletus reticuloceps TaxID=495285 RepID=A0A8I3A717_9AGAM|nr:hypothetical protein JVT61DRAFT_4801 [Boletus reticuloceps]